MKLDEVVTPNNKSVKCANAKCNSNVFSIGQHPLNGNGPSVAIVTCQQCGQIMGQLEPNSVTSNLGQIANIMTRVLPVLQSVENILSSPNKLKNREAQEVKPAMQGASTPDNPSANNAQQKQNSQGGTNPAADPLSSDPEADQSPV